MTSKRFHVERPEAGVITITIDRADRINSFDAAMVQEMTETIAAVEEESARVVILRSALPKVWVAGADITALRGLTLEAGASFVYAGHAMLRGIERSRKVYIAAIGGAALGGGTEMALACDLRVASRKASFGQPEVLLGVIPGWGGTQRLPRLLGESRAKELLLTGRRISAEEAHAIGLVNRLCDPEELNEAALALAREVLANGPGAVERTKRAVTEGMRASLDQGLVIEAEMFVGNLGSAERDEGMSALVEKRKPQWESGE